MNSEWFSPEWIRTYNRIDRGLPAVRDAVAATLGRPRAQNLPTRPRDEPAPLVINKSASAGKSEAILARVYRKIFVELGNEPVDPFMVYPRPR